MGYGIGRGQADRDEACACAAQAKRLRRVAAEMWAYCGEHMPCSACPRAKTCESNASGCGPCDLEMDLIDLGVI